MKKIDKYTEKKNQRPERREREDIEGLYNGGIKKLVLNRLNEQAGSSSEKGLSSSVFFIYLFSWIAAL